MSKAKPANCEPLWKDEFAIEAGHETLVNRRQFTKFLTLTSLAMFVGNLWILAKSWLYKEPLFIRQIIARSTDLPVGTVKLFHYPSKNDPCIMLRTRENLLFAYSQRCTHLACPVYFSAVTNRLECPCHEGSFSAETGEVIKGPPPRPLPKIMLEEKDGFIIATGVVLHS